MREPHQKERSHELRRMSPGAPRYEDKWGRKVEFVADTATTN